MKSLNLNNAGLGLCIAAMLLVGCGAPSAPTDAVSLLPQSAGRPHRWHGVMPVSLASFFQGDATFAGRGLASLRPQAQKCGTTCGVWASEFGATALYRYAYLTSGSPLCSVPNVADVNDIDTQTKSTVYVPDGEDGTIKVFRYKASSNQCPDRPKSTIANGPASMPIGQPSDVVPLNQGSTLFVANIIDYISSRPYYGPGSVSVCNQRGCTNYTNAAITGYAGGVACCTTSGSVNYCYLSAEGGAASSPTGVLLYYPNCTGQSRQATGFVNPSTGGLAVDSAGNLVAISISNAMAYVYGGCPNCQLLFESSLIGQPIYGHFNTLGGLFVVGDAANGSLDLYSYRYSGGSGSFTYDRSITEGLNASETPEGAAFIGWHD
jgi:hypothetical protein